ESDALTMVVSVAPGFWPMVLSVGIALVVSDAVTAVVSPFCGAAPTSSWPRLWQAASDAAAASIQTYLISCAPRAKGPCPPEGLSRYCPCAAGHNVVFGRAV